MAGAGAGAGAGAEIIDKGGAEKEPEPQQCLRVKLLIIHEEGPGWVVMTLYTVLYTVHIYYIIHICDYI